jgi:hypothetical protein
LSITYRKLDSGFAKHLKNAITASLFSFSDFVSALMGAACTGSSESCGGESTLPSGELVCD